MTQKYKFECGCEFEVLNENPLRLKFEPNIEKIPLDCKDTWNWIGEKSCKGIFQLDSQLSEHIVHQFKPKSLLELALCITISRPGCLDARTEENKTVTQSTIDRKLGLEEIKVNEHIIDILKDTFGHMAYQEQMMFIAAKIAGFNPGETNRLRKAAAKKKADLMAKLRIEFIEGCKKVGLITEDDANQIFDNIQASQRYSFNKCLNPNTLVLNANNEYETLDEVSIGEYIDSPYGFVRVEDKFENGIQEVYEVTLESGKTIECTLNHKFLCEDNKKYELWEILEKNLKIVTKEE